MASHSEETYDGPAAVRVTAFWMPKRGHEADEYEDAYASSQTDAFPVHVAVADGATESAFAQHWAQILANGLTAEGVSDASALRAALPQWQARWAQAVADRTRQQPWYAAAKAEQGAFAAMLGMALQPGGTWRALSIGDCCLFQFREGALLTAWPIDDPDAFTHRPELVPSRASHAVPEPEEAEARWEPDDMFLLASDALAAWLLRTDPASALVLDEETFSARVQAAREDGRLRNDDVTLLAIHILPA